MTNAQAEESTNNIIVSASYLLDLARNVTLIPKSSLLISEWSYGMYMRAMNHSLTGQ